MNAVTSAVLLAAGRGARLGPLTQDFPKAMLEVGGQPMLHRIIGGLANAGVVRFTIVSGHAAESLEQATGDGGRWGVHIRYVRQAVLDGTARALALARSDVGDSSFFVGWGDIVVDAANYGRVIAAAGPTGASLAVNEVDDPHAGAAVEVDDDWAVTRIVEKPPKGTSNTRWNNAGLSVLPPEIWGFVAALQPSSRGEYELPGAIAAFIAAGGRIRAVPIAGPWFDAGTPESLAAARLHFGG